MKLTKQTLNYRISTLEVDRKKLQDSLEELIINEELIKHSLKETRDSLNKLDELEQLNNMLFDSEYVLEVAYDKENK